MAEETRSVTLTGEAAKAITGGSVKKRATRKKQEGGAMLRGVSDNGMAVKGVENAGVANAGSPNPSSWLSYKNTTTLTPPMIQPVINRAPTPPALSAAPTPQYKAQGGDAKDVKNIKVELKKNISAKKVKLQPKKAAEVKPALKKNQTKKSRKITLGVAQLHKRMTRAKKVHHKIKEMPIDKLKKLLIEKKLIKPTSKAPESILRQIAADSQIMEGKSL